MSPRFSDEFSEEFWASCSNRPAISLSRPTIRSSSTSQPGGEAELSLSDWIGFEGQHIWIFSSQIKMTVLSHI